MWSYYCKLSKKFIICACFIGHLTKNLYIWPPGGRDKDKNNSFYFSESWPGHLTIIHSTKGEIIYVYLWPLYIHELFSYFSNLVVSSPEVVCSAGKESPRSVRTNSLLLSGDWTLSGGEVNKWGCYTSMHCHGRNAGALSRREREKERP